MVKVSRAAAVMPILIHIFEHSSTGCEGDLKRVIIDASQVVMI